VWHEEGGGTSGTTSFGVAIKGQYTLTVSAAFTITSSGAFWAVCSGGGIVSIDPEITVMQVATLH
jgi:hypothetical protein